MSATSYLFHSKAAGGNTIALWRARRPLQGGA
jgi:hypothetical protein